MNPFISEWVETETFTYICLGDLTSYNILLLSRELTVAGVRRLLEEDLELKKFSLDPFKKFISKQLDEVR